jgi:predicted DNA-binding transcriptional regulator AlpA
MSRQINQGTRISVFDVLPDSAFVRESQLVQDPQRPEFPAPLPFSAATLWRKVAAGTFPKPFKLSQRVTAWRVADVRTFLQTPNKGLV